MSTTIYHAPEPETMLAIDRQVSAPDEVPMMEPNYSGGHAQVVRTAFARGGLIDPNAAVYVGEGGDVRITGHARRPIRDAPQA